MEVGYPKIFVISLLRSDERRESINRQMLQFGLEFEYFDAIDAIKLTDEDLKIYDERMALSDYGATMTKGEVACALSHFKVHEKIVNENIERAIIFEDDIVLSEDFIGVLGSRDRFPVDAELIYYFHGKAKSFPWKRRQIYRDYKMVKYRVPTRKSKRSIIYAAAYELTRLGAEKVLKKAYPIQMPVDIHLGYIQRNGAIAYGIEPNCLSLAGFETTIPGRFD